MELQILFTSHDLSIIQHFHATGKLLTITADEKGAMLVLLEAFPPCRCTEVVGSHNYPSKLLPFEPKSQRRHKEKKREGSMKQVEAFLLQ